MNILTTTVFDDWFAGLRDWQAKAKAELGNLGDYKAVGEGVFEMRIFYGPGPGYRVYFVLRGSEIVVLLAGGDKSTQSADIDTAIQLSKRV